MTSCECPTCGGRIRADRLVVSGDGRWAFKGDVSTRLEARQGHILRVLARQTETIDAEDICDRVAAATGKRFNRRHLHVQLSRMKQSLAELGLEIINYDGYRLIPYAPGL